MESVPLLGSSIPNDEQVIQDTVYHGILTHRSVLFLNGRGKNYLRDNLTHLVCTIDDIVSAFYTGKIKLDELHFIVYKVRNVDPDKITYKMLHKLRKLDNSKIIKITLFKECMGIRTNNTSFARFVLPKTYIFAKIYKKQAQITRKNKEQLKKYMKDHNIKKGRLTFSWLGLMQDIMKHEIKQIVSDNYLDH